MPAMSEAPLMMVRTEPVAHQRDAAAYIRDMAEELRSLASLHDMEFLAYLLAMVSAEASAAADNVIELPSDLRKRAGRD